MKGMLMDEMQNMWRKEHDNPRCNKSKSWARKAAGDKEKTE